MKAINFILLSALATAAFAQVRNGDVHVIPVQGNIYMLVGPGGNTTIQVGKDGALIDVSVRWALDHYRAGAGEAGRAIESNPPGEWGNY